MKKNEPDVIIIPLHSPSEKTSSVLTPTEIKCSETKRETSKELSNEHVERQPVEMESVSESFKQEVILETNKILELLKNDASMDEPVVNNDKIVKTDKLDKQIKEPQISKEISVEKQMEETDVQVATSEKEITKDYIEESQLEKKKIEDNKVNKPTILQLETKCIKQIEEFAMSKSSSEKSKEEIKVTPEGETRTDNAIVITPDDIESESLLAKHTSDSGK